RRHEAAQGLAHGDDAAPTIATAQYVAGPPGVVRGHFGCGYVCRRGVLTGTDVDGERRHAGGTYQFGQVVQFGGLGIEGADHPQMPPGVHQRFPKRSVTHSKKMRKVSATRWQASASWSAGTSKVAHHCPKH